MKKKVNVRQWFAFFLFLAAVCAGLIQYNLNTSSNVDSGKLNAKDPGGQYGDAQYVNTKPINQGAFAQARIDREAAQSKYIDQLSSVVNAQIDIEASATAQKKLILISDVAKMEARIESIIKTNNGYKDVLVTIGDDKSVDVLVQASKLTAVEATKIADTAARQASVTMDKVYVKVSE